MTAGAAGDIDDIIIHDIIEKQRDRAGAAAGRGSDRHHPVRVVGCAGGQESANVTDTQHDTPR
jgi:hypothetical protein